jgi:hypothetical protein
MPDFVFLKAGEEPPPGQGWALVAPDSCPPSLRRRAGRQDKSAIFFLPARPTELDRCEAIARARGWAQNNDVSKVYIAIG